MTKAMTVLILTSVALTLKCSAQSWDFNSRAFRDFMPPNLYNTAKDFIQRFHAPYDHDDTPDKFLITFSGVTAFIQQEIYKKLVNQTDSLQIIASQSGELAKGIQKVV